MPKTTKTPKLDGAQRQILRAILGRLEEACDDLDTLADDFRIDIADNAATPADATALDALIQAQDRIRDAARAVEADLLGRPR